MKRKVVLLLAVAVFFSGTAHGNSFFDGLVGKWSQTTSLFVDGYKESFKYRIHFRKLRSGNYYSATFQNGKKTQESWYYKGGKFATMTYTDEGFYNGEGSGSWRVKNGRLVVDQALETLELEDVRMNTAMRKLERNKYAMSGTVVVDGYRVRVTATLVRIR